MLYDFVGHEQRQVGEVPDSSRVNLRVSIYMARKHQPLAVAVETRAMSHLAQHRFGGQHRDDPLLIPRRHPKRATPVSKSAFTDDVYLAVVLTPRTATIRCVVHDEEQKVAGTIEEVENNHSRLPADRGFKEYSAVLFFTGSLLKDANRFLVQQTKNVQAMEREWMMSAFDEAI